MTDLETAILQLMDSLCLGWGFSSRQIVGGISLAAHAWSRASSLLPY
jgi:hypothetical protein